MEFKDHFSDQAEDYQRYRPQYPGRLIQYLVSLVRARDQAWDCGTGNGQVAQMLAAYFTQVIATDASEEQIAQAPAIDNVDFRVEPAEVTDIEKDSVDLLTVGQAMHWFELEDFYDEANRVMVDGGVIAAWTYQLCYVNDEINELIQSYYHQVVGPYWPEERKMVENGYRDLSFPFEEIDPPDFRIEMDWTLEQLLGYLRTWSAARRFRQDKNADPVEPLENYFERAWGDPDQLRRVYWPLMMRVGRKK